MTVVPARPLPSHRRSRRHRPEPAPLSSELLQLQRQFLSYVRVECGLAPNSLAAYGRDLEDLLRDLAAHGVKTAGAITARHLASHLGDLKSSRGLASTSIIRHLATIRIFARWLVARGFVADDPAEILERPTRWRRLPGVLSPRDLKRLIETPGPADDAGPPLWLRDRALLELMYASGLRASEAADLAVTDLHESLGVVRVTGKGRKQRLVPVGKPALEAVRRCGIL